MTNLFYPVWFADVADSRRHHFWMETALGETTPRKLRHTWHISPVSGWRFQSEKKPWIATMLIAKTNGRSWPKNIASPTWPILWHGGSSCWMWFVVISWWDCCHLLETRARAHVIYSEAVFGPCETKSWDIGTPAACRIMMGTPPPSPTFWGGRSAGGPKVKTTPAGAINWKAPIKRRDRMAQALENNNYYALDC